MKIDLLFLEIHPPKSSFTLRQQHQCFVLLLLTSQMGATPIQDDSDSAKMGTMVTSGGFHTVTAMAKENIFKNLL